MQKVGIWDLVFGIRGEKIGTWKKGVSSLISITLLILLTISVSTFLYAYISRTGVLLGPEFNCLDSRMDGELKIKDACFSDGKLVVSLKRGNGDLEIGELNFVIDGDSYFCGCENCFVLGDGELRDYYFDYFEKPEKVLVSVDGCVFDEVSVEEC